MTIHRHVCSCENCASQPDTVTITISRLSAENIGLPHGNMMTPEMLIARENARWEIVAACNAGLAALREDG